MSARTVRNPSHRLGRHVGPALPQIIPGAGGHGQQHSPACRYPWCRVRKSRRWWSPVDGERRVAGSGTGGPGPGQQLPAHPVQLTDGPQRKLRRKVPRVDGAHARPGCEEVRPVRNASASSMQSPPASAEATSVSILSVLICPGRAPVRVRAPRCRARVAGKAAHCCHQAGVVEGDSDAVGVVASGSISWVLLASGTGFLSRKPLSQRHRSIFLLGPRYTPAAVDRGLKSRCLLNRPKIFMMLLARFLAAFC